MVSSQQVQKGKVVVVLFGVTGDLAKRKLIPALYQFCSQKGQVSDVEVIGVGRKRKTSGELKDAVSAALKTYANVKNAPSHFGDLKSDQKFQGLFWKCMSGCDSKEEFESTWSYMINEYKLQNHKWLKSMYKIRHKWSTTYSKDVFSADIKSSQRSESTNSVPWMGLLIFSITWTTLLMFLLLLLVHL